MRFTFCFIVSLLPLLTLAKPTPGPAEKFKLSGVIVDKGEKPISFVNAAIYNQPDSALITGAVSNDEGRFTVSLEPGSYYVKLTFISYEEKIVSDIKITNKDINLGTISLEENTDVLNEVVVEGEREQMRLELDKRVFNVGEDANNASRNAADILDNLPSVSVDVEGNVSLRGSQNVKILVDGRPSGLVGISSTDALRQLQGNIIDRIEVVTNPSAKYEAEGSAGIINIVLKKDKRTGFNGAFTGNIGHPLDLGISGNLNYRAGNFNIFGNYGLSYDKRTGGGYSNQEFFFDDTTYTTRTDRDRERGGISHSFRMGTDFYLTDKDIFTGSGLIRISDEDNDTNIRYQDIAGDGTLVANTLRTDNEKEDDDNFEYQLSYKRILPGKDHELIVDLQYRDSYETEKSNIEESNSGTNEDPYGYQRSLNKEGDKNILIQADYVHPITDDKKFEAGYRGTIREITSNYHVEELDNTTGDWESLEGFSNQFTYDENVQAAYAIYGNKAGTWGYQLGLRAENTIISTFQRETQETNEKNYLDFFPSIFVSYKLNKSNTAQASYSRRISRPRFWYLNPFYSYSDPRNIRTGNPYVSPEYTDSYELGFLSNLEKASIYGGVYYRHTTGSIERVTYVEYLEGDTIATTFSQPHNIGIENAFGVEANFSFDPAEWYHLDGNANFYRSMIDGTFQEEELSRDTYSMHFQLSNKVSFGDFDVQLRGWYRAPEETTQGKRKSMYSVDLGANWQILAGRGTLTFNVRDLFNTRKYRGITEGDNFYSESEFQWRSRQAGISLTYLINRKKGQRNGNGGEENGGGFNGGGDGMDF